MQSRREKWDRCARLFVRPKNKGEWHILFHNLLRLQIISGWGKVGVNDRLHRSNLILVMLEILQIQIFFFFYFIYQTTASVRCPGPDLRKICDSVGITLYVPLFLISFEINCHGRSKSLWIVYGANWCSTYIEIEHFYTHNKTFRIKKNQPAQYAEERSAK